MSSLARQRSRRRSGPGHRLLRESRSSNTHRFKQLRGVCEQSAGPNLLTPCLLSPEQRALISSRMLLRIGLSGGVRSCPVLALSVPSSLKSRGVIATSRLLRIPFNHCPELFLARGKPGEEACAKCLPVTHTHTHHGRGTEEVCVPNTSHAIGLCYLDNIANRRIPIDNGIRRASSISTESIKCNRARTNGVNAVEFGSSPNHDIRRASTPPCRNCNTFQRRPMAHLSGTSQEFRASVSHVPQFGGFGVQG